ncbi:anthranilate 1,2-dioxygenase small subunit [Polaromonas sp. OV174]|uniref:aromatic-ring-hydroxylating dioxygenase subunit beta n=1 Tax=Polaromonas sp. OV174 TaxID=1855300 RepID=UPI0008ECF6BB|nr:aromatic-ring-hydroxylating dioxygenase subunit beta [Polaromonas sp. OV174]SFB89954.1 anthranilate 1,2-dioxygenase small subunit [Polaromonas sp. OV174]
MVDFSKETAAALRGQLRDFYDDYAFCLDEVELEKWPDFFVEECHYRIQSRENHDANLPVGIVYCMNKNMLKDRVTALRNTTVYEPRTLRHFISGVRIDQVSPGEIRTQANFLIIESMSDQEPMVNMVGRYIDRIVLENGSLKIKSRDCVYDNYQILTSLIIPV